MRTVELLNEAPGDLMLLGEREEVHEEREGELFA